MNLTLMERCIANLLLQGCPNSEIGQQLGITERTVKQYMHMLFVKFNVTNGVKRVKLAVLLLRKKEWQIADNSEDQQRCLKEIEIRRQKSGWSSEGSLRGRKIKRLQGSLELPKELSKIVSEASSTNSDSGIGPRLLCGTNLEKIAIH